jgi:hypothetical protein
LDPLDVHVVELCNLERIGQRFSPAHIKMNYSYYITCRNCEYSYNNNTRRRGTAMIRGFDKMGIYEEETSFYI